MRLSKRLVWVVDCSAWARREGRSLGFRMAGLALSLSMFADVDVVVLVGSSGGGW